MQADARIITSNGGDRTAGADKIQNHLHPIVGGAWAHAAGIIRGDVRGATGWGNATRALASVLRPYFRQLFLVDVYGSPPTDSIIPDPIVADGQIPKIVDLHESAVLFNMCLPHDGLLPRNCHCISYFFIECETWPAHLDWPKWVGLHDQVWVPSEWQKRVADKYLGNSGPPVFVIPWPQPFDHSVQGEVSLSHTPVAAVLSRSQLEKLHIIDQKHREILSSRLPGLKPWRTWAKERRSKSGDELASEKLELIDASMSDLEELLSRYEHAFLAVQTDAARKGSVVLARAWAEHVRSSQGRSCLLIRHSSVDRNKNKRDIHVELSETFADAFTRANISDRSHVFVIHGFMPDDELQMLFRRCRALVTATYGEGFGGPIADAIRFGIPVVAPRHTALENIIPADYPYLVSSTPYRGALVQNFDVYSPASEWYVPDALDLGQRLTQLLDGRVSEDAANAAREALLRFCGTASVDERVRAALGMLGNN
jgi:glycosyltransferase involved in cell wall biosynthesis